MMTTTTTRNYNIAYFITDHGFGHAARSCELITKLVQMHPIKVTVVTSVPEWFLRERLSLNHNTLTTDISSSTDGFHQRNMNIDFIQTQVDVGVIQELTDKELVVNVKETLKHLDSFWLDKSVLSLKVDHIRERLALKNIDCIVYDITPLAPTVAREMNVPCIAVTNFAWNWLYEDWMTQKIYDYQLTELETQLLKQMIQFITDAYSETKLFIKLPYCADGMAGLSSAPSQIDLNAWLSGVQISNAGSLEHKQYVLKTLFPNQDLTNTKLILYSFGGGQELQQSLAKDQMLKKWHVPEDWSILINMKDAPVDMNPDLKHRVLFFTHDQLTEHDLTMIDVLTSVDILCCKTGYGVVSEALAANVAGVLYCDRPGFCEHYQLVQALEESLQDRCQFVRMWEDVLHASDHLFHCANVALQAYNNQKGSAVLPMDGGIRAAKHIFDFIQSNTTN
jgi:predicted glycosyltransferase